MSSKTETSPCRSGWCNPDSPDWSHARCTKVDCPCEHHLEEWPIEPGVDPDQEPDQPPGISSYSLDLPNPLRAATRVCEFLSAYGDGRVMDPEWDGPPLFARDLQALANAALGRAS